MSPVDDYWNARPITKWVILSLAVIVIGGALWFLFLDHGEGRSERILREKASLSAEDQLNLIDAGAFMRPDGSVDGGTILWCGRVNGEAERVLATLESRSRRGRVDFLDAAVAGATRSDRERRMIVQCRERL